MQSKLADVRMISDRSSELPFAINDGQLAMMDIDIAIVNSDIPGRAEISRLLNDFMDLGQSTVFELMKYHASCVASVDFALSLNYWTKRSLQEIEAKYSTPISLAWNNALSIVGGKTKMGSVQRIYFWYTEDLHLELRGLITQGERLTRDLRTLIEKLKSALAILGLEQKISSAKTQDLDTIWARIFQLHRTELQVMKNQLGLMTGLISDIKRARKGTADTTDKLRSINVEVRSLYEVLVRPGKHLMLNNADIGYYLSEIETLIGILEKGRTKVKSYSQKNMTSLGLNK
ncbi:hypothetical protein MMC11_000950 [Xylographa trunciseda]|nr:hypothetical protein [Xylographa trunciseda]